MSKPKVPMRVRVYKYHLLPSTSDEATQQRIREQLFLANQYRNTLCDIERAKRAMARDANIRKPDKKDPWLRWFGYEIALTAQRDTANEVQRWINQSYSNLQLTWGTRGIVNQHCDLWDELPLSQDPEFKRFSGTGTIGVCVLSGMSSAELLNGTHTQARIVPAPVTSTTDKHGRPRRVERLRELWLRVGSDEKRQPIWATWPLRYGRSIPPDAIIRQIKVTARREGTRMRWSCSVVVREPVTPTRSGTRALAIDVRWRSMAGDLCVSYWRDTDGNHGEILLDPRTRPGAAYADHLKSIRDQHTDLLKPALAEWIHSMPDAPDWFKQTTKTLSLWKSNPRFRRLWFAWSKQRFAGDEVGFALLDRWWRGDRWTPETRQQSGEYHLADWEAAQRRRALQRRNETYNLLAATWARTYDHIIIEDFDKRTFAAKTDRDVTDDADKEKKRHRDNAVEHNQRCNQRYAAPSVLCSHVERAATTHGAHLWKIECAYATISCHVCHHIDEWDPGKELKHTCSKCGTSWDQRDNATRNLLDLWRERRRTAKTKPQKSQVDVGRWAKRKAKRSQQDVQPSDIPS